MEVSFLLGMFCGCIVNEWLFPQSKTTVDLKVKNSTIDSAKLPIFKPKRSFFKRIFSRGKV